MVGSPTLSATLWERTVPAKGRGTSDDEALLGEAADLMYHLSVLLRSRGLPMSDAIGVLKDRHRP